MSRNVKALDLSRDIECFWYHNDGYGYREEIEDPEKFVENMVLALLKGKTGRIVDTLFHIKKLSSKEIDECELYSLIGRIAEFAA